MMHLGNYRSEKTSLGTFPTKSWSNHLSTSPLLKLPPRHSHSLSRALSPYRRPVLVKEIGAGALLSWVSRTQQLRSDPQGHRHLWGSRSPSYRQPVSQV